MIVNPIAVPDPSAAEGNYSWMYLITPYYNQLIKEFNEKEQENHVLKLHFDYYMEMEKEKELLNEEFQMLHSSEKHLMDKINMVNNENGILDDKARNLERNFE